MIDTKSLLEDIHGDDKAKGWAAVQALVNIRPTTEEEAKARGVGCCALAEAHFIRTKLGTAIDWWQEAIDCDPMNATYRLAMVARGLLPARMLRQSLNEVTRSIKMDNKNPEAFRLLGHIHLEMKNTKAAIEAFDKQLSMAPDNPVSYLDRIDIALDLSDWDTVEKYSKKLRETHNSQTGNALHQMGLMVFRQGKHEEALRLWDEALTYECDHREVVAWNQSMALLALGQYRDGWRKHETRGMSERDPSMAIQTHRGMRELLFNNEPPPAKLHVHQEMGFGDAIAMARYLPLLVEKGYEVTFEVIESLVDLMRYSLPGVNVIPQAIFYPNLMGVPKFDYLVPALSLPRLFGTEVKTIPWRGPYLKADPQKVKEYREKLGGGPAVGICWSAGVRTEYSIWLEEYGKRKSISIDELSPIVNALLGHKLVSLQVGPERENGTFIDLLPADPTWADTAALVECLDFVITVDTGLAHLVGAMGKPLWLMCQRDSASWHWMAYRDGAEWNETSPWYPSAKIFRQHAGDDPHRWDSVIGDVAGELKSCKSLAA